MPDPQAQLRELIEQKAAQLHTIDMGSNCAIAERDSAASCIKIMVECLALLETTKGKVIDNDRGNDSPLDVATPGTAHPRATIRAEILIGFLDEMVTSTTDVNIIRQNCAQSFLIEVNHEDKGVILSARGATLLEAIENLWTADSKAQPRAELPPFRSVDELAYELSDNCPEDEVSNAYYDLCREHEQRIKILARGLRIFIDMSTNETVRANAEIGLKSAGLWPLPEGW